MLSLKRICVSTSQSTNIVSTDSMISKKTGYPIHTPQARCYNVIARVSVMSCVCLCVFVQYARSKSWARMQAALSLKVKVFVVFSRSGARARTPGQPVVPDATRWCCHRIGRYTLAFANSLVHTRARARAHARTHTVVSRFCARARLRTHEHTRLSEWGNQKMFTKLCHELLAKSDQSQQQQLQQKHNPTRIHFRVKTTIDAASPEMIAPNPQGH